MMENTSWILKLKVFSVHIVFQGAKWNRRLLALVHDDTALYYPAAVEEIHQPYLTYVLLELV